MGENKSDELKELRERYRKSCKMGFMAGCGFLVSATVMTILSFALDKPSVLIGVALQLIAGVTLIITNKGGLKDGNI